MMRALGMAAILATATQAQAFVAEEGLQGRLSNLLVKQCGIFGAIVEEDLMEVPEFETLDEHLPNAQRFEGRKKVPDELKEIHVSSLERGHALRDMQSFTEWSQVASLLRDQAEVECLATTANIKLND